MLKKIIFACCLFCVASIASASADDSSMPREIVENFIMITLLRLKCLIWNQLIN